MNSKQLAVLISEWEVFSSEGEPSLQEFASWLLAKQESRNAESYDEEDIQFKIMDLSRLLQLQAKSLFEGDAGELQLVRILSIVEILKKPIKQEVVKSSLLEPSTGFYLLKELVKKDLLQESANPDDKRAVVMVLTSKGKTFLQKKRKNLRKIALMNAVHSSGDKKSFLKTLGVLYRYHLSKIEKERAHPPT